MATTDAEAAPGLSVPEESDRVAARPPRRRAVRIRGREYPILLPSIRDPRLHVAVVLLTLQALGQTVLGFRLSVAQILACLVAGALIEFVVSFFKDHTIMWPASGLLTGNSAAFILRVPGTVHGDWWSTRGIWIFVGVVAVSMASKYLIRWKGRHIFNPSNLGLVLAFVILGPKYTEPMDLFWIPMGQWMLVTYAILILGGLFIAWELKLLGLELGFMAAFATFLAIALIPVPDHCMVASWHVTAMCGWQLWNVIVTSPELLIFAFFMMPDPRTVPDGQGSRFVFGVLVALLAVLLIGPTALEFWTKTAILASLVIACALRFALVRLLAPLEEGGGPHAIRRLGLVAPAMLGVFLVLVSTLPVAAEISTYGPEPVAGAIDGSNPVLPLSVGNGTQDLGNWVATYAGVALPPKGNPGAGSASGRLWVLPPMPPVSIAQNVMSFDPSMNQTRANQMAHDVVLDLMIESEARRAHDLKLAESGAVADGLKEFTEVINDDIAGGKSIQKTYTFDQVKVTLWLPKFSGQAARLIGVSLHGTSTLITRDASGNVVSQTTTPYTKAWGLQFDSNFPNQLIAIDYTFQGLAPAP
jgi:Na+-translocating ferredoxin:NAD+ oxidoreductase RnfD subunit